jgi:hypothetical protein
MNFPIYTSFHKVSMDGKENMKDCYGSLSKQNLAISFTGR